MRILFCNFEYPPLGGGGGFVNALLAEELAKRHEVTVLTSQGLGLAGETQENGVRIVRVPVFFRRQETAANMASMFVYLPMGIRAGKQLLKRTAYDVINTHFVLPTGPVGDYLAHFARIPHVLTVHGGDLYDPSKWTSPHRHGMLRVWIRYLLRRADQIVGQSRNTLDNLHRFYDPASNAVLIPLGIRRPRIETVSRQRYGFSDNAVLLVTIGRLVARKAVDQLITLMTRLSATDTHLLIMGSGPQEQPLRKTAQQLQISERIHFFGQVEEAEKFQLLSLSDIYLSASQHEGFGLVFLEAMACGLPVLCYDHGGQTDFLENERTGYLIKLNDRQSLTEHCRQLIEQVETRRHMGEYNRRKVEDFFIDRCATRYEDLFTQVVTGYGKERVIKDPRPL
jgi:glycosyltransferase involved in cell wall biosynthesis